MDQVALGFARTCVVVGGQVKCWGHPVAGALGYANVDILGDDELLTDLPSGLGRHVCGREESVLRCWGYNVFGQLGYGHTDDIGDDEVPSTAGEVMYQ